MSNILGTNLNTDTIFFLLLTGKVTRLTIWMGLCAIVMMLMTPIQGIYTEVMATPSTSTPGSAPPTDPTGKTLEPVPQEDQDETSEDEQNGGDGSDGVDGTNGEESALTPEDVDGNRQDFDEFSCQAPSGTGGTCFCYSAGDCVKMVLSGQCKDGTWKETGDTSGECDWNV